MKYYSIKDKRFNVFGSTALNEEGYNRFNLSERELIQPISQDVCYLSTMPAGINVKFKTTSPNIYARVRLNEKANMPHMPATGQCGVDLYFYSEELKDFALHNVATFDTTKDQYELRIGSFETSEERRFIINLPLYMGVKEVEIGVDDEYEINGDTFNNDGRIVVYGTSITQGGCVSRPGMLYTNLLSRWLDCEFLNYGFSGAAMGEKEVASIIGTRNKQKLFIIDIEANAGIDERMEQRLPAFIDEYHRLQPNVPIIIVSRIMFAMDLYDEKRNKLRTYYRKYLRDLVKSYQKQGMRVTFLDGNKFFKGNYTEYTVDGIHPTDLGSFAIAKAYYKEIIKVLRG
jgi:lysophospholipase L1-like esterase